MVKKNAKKGVDTSFERVKLTQSDLVLSGSLWKIFDISLFSRDINQVLSVLDSKLALKERKYWVATVNPEFIMESQKDKDFAGILAKTSINVMDGIGLIWARELSCRSSNKFINGIKIGIEVLQGKHRDQVASGADLMLNLGEIAAKRDLKIFFLGGFGDRAKKTAAFFRKKFYLNKEQLDWSCGEPNVTNEEVVKKINKFKPDILLVAYGMKKQEFWIENNLKKIDVGLVMGVGRSFDYYSGELKRAPKKWQKMGLEWLYSLIKEPKRFKRQLVLPKFVWKVLKNK
ncbi:N-acetylglucosaminyldiphosphoundecaprenol N-acetyl-beta-D-mannosaminyltransferase [bioreactor metagenome]|uniref:N-acetylglucosaminyldiphosphoundecaprenol N-acetyl-beta-D-mannosaminyltransferase n=1 Tax=bioreactor metagenome TaxID=1076179 RepID=A0A645CEK3_9ZZZZ